MLVARPQQRVLTSTTFVLSLLCVTWPCFDPPLPPAGLPAIEIACLHKVLHLAANALSYAAPIEHRDIISLRARPLLSSMSAAMLRAAHITFKRIDLLDSELREVVLECLPLGHFRTGLFRPIGRDNIAIVVNLLGALRFKKYKHNHIPCYTKWLIGGLRRVGLSSCSLSLRPFSLALFRRIGTIPLLGAFTPSVALLLAIPAKLLGTSKLLPKAHSVCLSHGAERAYK